MIREPEAWKDQYKKRGALWITDENPLRPHALLHSGKHSGGFFNSELVMEDPQLLDEAANDLISLFDEAAADLSGIQDWDIRKIDRVVGPAMGAITLAHDLARHISLESSRVCLRAYVEKITVGEGEKPRMILMVFKRTSIRSGEMIILAEDVVTTGDSVNLAAEAVEKAGGFVWPAVFALVNRSGLHEINGRRILALFDHHMPTWDPTIEECPLCAMGSEAILPKGKENWERLNADY